MTGNVPFLRRQYLTLLRGTVASQCERRSTRTADGTSGPRAFPNLPLSFLIKIKIKIKIKNQGHDQERRTGVSDPHGLMRAGGPLHS